MTTRCDDIQLLGLSQLIHWGCLATRACLTKHEHCSHSSIQSNLHQGLCCLLIDHLIRYIFWKNTIKSIVDMSDEGSLQVCLELAVM